LLFIHVFPDIFQPLIHILSPISTKNAFTG